MDVSKRVRRSPFPFVLFFFFGFTWLLKRSAVKCLVHRKLSKILTHFVKSLNSSQQMAETKKTHSCWRANGLRFKYLHIVYFVYVCQFRLEIMAFKRWLEHSIHIQVMVEVCWMQNLYAHVSPVGRRGCVEVGRIVKILSLVVEWHHCRHISGCPGIPDFLHS